MKITINLNKKQLQNDEDGFILIASLEMHSRGYSRSILM